ncbi:uncharacterized protein LOC129248735 [Anastrepha obliqua]|uniref:uncharacterized protein LOC129248735 n=1 Tax=Anastrepha obliqua TaxID=95512 RepID=UPI00240A2492|nr:uncharacterized protein LOC129248735 [Anastrepha obliqua]
MAAHILTVLFLLISFSQVSLILTAASETSQKQQNTSLSITEDYKTLRNDAQWFFQNVEVIADILVHILPEIDTEGSRSLQSTTEDVSFVENTRLTLLIGLRHVLVGVKEISVAFQSHLSGDHELQLLQIQTVALLFQDVISFAKYWLSMLRNSVSELFRIYNYYIPEMLLGKCFVKYITTTYPDSSFYQYPFILIREVIDFGLFYLRKLQIYERVKETPPPPAIEANDEQNEIWTNEILNKYSRSLGFVKNYDAQKTSLKSSKHPLQKCFEMYAAESILKLVKIFFIGD